MAFDIFAIPVILSEYKQTFSKASCIILGNLSNDIVEIGETIQS